MVKFVKVELENELKKYNLYRMRLQAIDNELQEFKISTSKFKDMPLTKMVGNPTLNAVADREKYHQEKIRLINKINRINRVLEALSKDQKKIIELRYFECKQRQFILDHLKISRSTYYNLLEDALKIYAQIVGKISIFD